MNMRKNIKQIFDGLAPVTLTTRINLEISRINVSLQSNRQDQKETEKEYKQELRQFRIVSLQDQIDAHQVSRKLDILWNKLILLRQREDFLKFGMKVAILKNYQKISPARKLDYSKALTAAETKLKLYRDGGAGRHGYGPFGSRPNYCVILFRG
jgi:hypothetical protein